MRDGSLFTPDFPRRWGRQCQGQVFVIFLDTAGTWIMFEGKILLPLAIDIIVSWLSGI